METTCYLIIIVFLLVLAVVDLFVGVSNDAVNFMNSAIGAKVARFRTVLIVASLLLFQRGDDALPSRNGNGCDCP